MISSDARLVHSRPPNGSAMEGRLFNIHRQRACARKLLKGLRTTRRSRTDPRKINDLIRTVDQEVGGSSPPSCTIIPSPSPIRVCSLTATLCYTSRTWPGAAVPIGFSRHSARSVASLAGLVAPLDHPRPTPITSGGQTRSKNNRWVRPSA